MIAITPFIDPSKLGEYQDRILELYRLDAELNGLVPKSIRASVEWLLRSVNCYYSNKIEGNKTHPKELMKSQGFQDSASELPTDIIELLAHLEVQIMLKNRVVDKGEVVSQGFIKELHNAFYCDGDLPEDLLALKDAEGSPYLDSENKPVFIVPGDYRDRNVIVGKHHPPKTEDIQGYMQWLEQRFNPVHIHGTTPVIAAAGLHHRLAWIHPFAGGNGRVVRLLTDCYMRCAGFGGYGLWSLSRGFCRDSKEYYKALAEADKPRQGNSDGRGILSDAGLMYFTKYFVDTALDQVRFFKGLLEPTGLRQRIQLYFELRARGATPAEEDGESLPLMKIIAKDIYITLLDRGEMTRSELCAALRKGEQTLRPVLKQMHQEQLIKLEPKQPIKLLLSPHAVGVMFPRLW